MPKLVSAHLTTYKCPSCGAVSSAEPEEFEHLNTIPPSYRAQCAFCAMSVGDTMSYLQNRLTSMGR